MASYNSSSSLLPTAGLLAAVLGVASGATGCVAEVGMDADAQQDVQAYGAALQAPGSEEDYLDPGRGDWQWGDAEECGIDVSQLQDGHISKYAVFRRGKLCVQKGNNFGGPMFSGTKTLGAVMLGRAAYVTRDIPSTGPGTGTIDPHDLAADWLGQVHYNEDATLSHVMAMLAHNESLSEGYKTWSYDGLGDVQINSLLDVTRKAVRQTRWWRSDPWSFVEDELFDKLGMDDSLFAPGPLGIASGWWANMADMGKLGTLLLHDGWYGGERLLSRQWVYGMSHAAFEDANTAYAHLTWVNHRGNAVGTEDDMAGDYALGDPCAPAAVWPEYPHGLSPATDCHPGCDQADAACEGVCAQVHDVGVFAAQGLNGQYIVMHPGLDMVIVARHFDDDDGAIQLWNAVRPALRAMDPVYGDDPDDSAFCAAYGAGAYAPDLPMPRHP